MDKEKFIKEKKYLEYVTEIIQKKIINKDYKITKSKNKILENIKYMYEAGLSEKIQLLTDNTTEKNTIQRESKINMKYIKMLYSPYFARFDFQDDFGLHKVYIGLAGLQTENYEILIIDWRTPIAGMYYDYTLGSASYNSPQGRISGEILLKRQIDILDGKITNLFDTNIEIIDDVLKKVLSKGTTPKLKSIINTIQIKQNEIIRSTAPNLFIQGCAGSGKSVVAMHRIAYLLYRDKEKITNKEILIFTPNDVFSKYLLEILPSIGAEQVYQTTLKEFISNIIPEFEIVTNIEEYYEMIYSDTYLNTSMVFGKTMSYRLSFEEKKVLDFKTTKLYAVIDKYFDYIRNTIIEEDFIYNEHFKITREELYEYRDKFFPNYVLNDQLEGIKARLIYLLEERIPDSQFIHESKQKIKKIKKLDSKKLYKDLFLNIKLLNEFSENEEEFNILRSNFIDIVNNNLRYEDILPYIYFKSKIEEFNTLDIKHIVIDEVQDYAALYVQLIKKVFSNANFTLVGDVNQDINRNFNLDNTLKVFKDIEYTTLETNYRNTAQIAEFSDKIIDKKNSIYFDRNGEEIKLIKSDHRINNNVLDHVTKNKIGITAIIVKNNRELKEIRKLILSEYMEHKINLIYNNSCSIKQGINVIPAYLAKGLEFDYCIILNATSYNKEQDRNLYYVSCTRAVHKLEIFYSGNLYFEN